jgi:hypothetical protein
MMTMGLGRRKHFDVASILSGYLAYRMLLYLYSTDSPTSSHAKKALIKAASGDIPLKIMFFRKEKQGRGKSK